MDPPSQPAPSDSNSQPSQPSQTASDYIASQLSLEADAREALPYQFDTCTKPLGPLRQSVYACLTCTPPPASIHQNFTPAGVCYSCSISCHGEHNLVELFTKRDFECDCGTTRYNTSGTTCQLRHNAATGQKGGVKDEKAREGNKYNQNFEGRFCGCGDEYDAEMEKGTMFQCLGLGEVGEGGCGEDWWHPECLLGLPRSKHETKAKVELDGSLESVKEESEVVNGAADPASTTAPGEVDKDDTVPPGFPDEDDFDHLLCYKCVNAFPWIKQYANTPGFLTASNVAQTNGHGGNAPTEAPLEPAESKKRKAEDDLDDSQDSKRARAEAATTTQEESAPETNGHSAAPEQDDSAPQPNGYSTPDSASAKQDSQDEQEEAPHTNIALVPKHTLLPPAPTTDYISLFLKESFRDNFCRCPACFSRLAKHPQLLEEEESYEPPISESDGAVEDGNRSVNSGSILERGEAALSNMDRVRAIEGVMAYNHVKDKVKAFLQPFAESGTQASTLFYIAELLEEIFLHLEVADILISQIVCKTWREVIADSSKVQVALFLVPDSDTRIILPEKNTGFSLHDRNWPKDAATGRPVGVRANTALKRLLYPLADGRVAANEHGEARLPNLNCDDAGGSRTKMFLTQPPVVSLVLELLIGSATGPKPSVKVEKAEGITLGGVLDAMPRVLEKTEDKLISQHGGVVIQGSDLWTAVSFDEYRDHLLGRAWDEEEDGSDYETESDFDGESDVEYELERGSSCWALDEEEIRTTVRREAKVVPP